EVVPSIALHPPTSHLAMRWTVRDVDYRLLRRLIEIRDGQRALRTYEDPAAEENARTLGGRAGLTGTALDAVVEATRIAAALRVKAAGAATSPTSLTARGPHGSTNLAEELNWI